MSRVLRAAAETMVVKPASPTAARLDAAQILGQLSTWRAVGTPGEGLDGPVRAPPPIGSRVGPFFLDDVLGCGGMGIVYRAHDERLDRTVALKITAPGLADPHLLRREARRAAAVEHPHVATVFEVGEHDGHTYIAMELVEGISLRARLATPLGAPEAWAIAAQIADVLAHAHARGLVHRDLKPENVMLRPDGQVKVLDFGLAAGRGDPDHGFAGGTPGYMAPEQREAHAADARSDVYAFGVLLHELLTGQAPPVEGLPLAAVAAAPARFRELLRRCLAEHADERPDDGAALQAAFQLLRPRRWWLASAAGAAALVAGGGLALALTAPTRYPERELTALTAQSATVPVQDADLSPDGRTVVFSERRGLVRLDVATRDVELVARADTFYCARWFPDGRHVAVHDRGGKGRLLEIDAFTGAARVLPVGRAGCATPSPDGRWIVVDEPDGLYLHAISALRGDALDPGTRVLERDASSVIMSRTVWSPDAARFAVLTRPSRNTRAGVVHGVEVPSGRHSVLVRDNWLTASFGHAAIEWETATRLVFALTPRAPLQDLPTTLHTLVVDAKTGHAVGKPALREPIGPVALADLRFDAARTQLLAVSYQSGRDIYVGELTTGQAPALRAVDRVTFSGREERMSSWTPDGSGILFVAETVKAHRAMRQALPGYPESVVPAVAWSSWPVVRSDGAVFLWDVEPRDARDGRTDARLVRLDGDRLVEVFRPDAEIDLGLRVPPPVAWRTRCAARAPVCFAVHASTVAATVYELEHGRLVTRVDGDFVDARPSSDGQRLLLVGNRQAISIADLDGHILEEVAPTPGCGFVDAAWIPDDDAWVAAQICLRAVEMFQIVHIDAARRSTLLWGSPSVMALDLHVAPDGRRLAFTQETFANEIVLRPWRRRE